MPQPVKGPASAATQRILSITNHLNTPNQTTTNNHTKVKMSVDYKFHGWMGLNKDAAAGKMEWQEYEPKTWTEDDVDIKVTHCGVCGSDIHTLRSGWVSYKANKIHIVLMFCREQPYTRAVLGTK